MRTAGTIRQIDITRALRAALVAGVEVRVEISAGKIVLVPAGGSANDKLSIAENASALDGWRAKRDQG